MDVLLPSAYLCIVTVMLLVVSQCVGSSVNVALKRPTTQVDLTHNSHFANDGNYNQNYDAYSCSCTSVKSNTWWMVDLLRPYSIHTIRMMNRDVYDYRLQGFEIYVSESNPLPTIPSSDGKLCVYYPGILPKTSLQHIGCKHKHKGRYVYVWKPAHDELTMCEFEVIVDKEESREAVSTVLHSGQRSTLEPVSWKQLKQISSTSCMAVCMAESEEGITHYQMNRHSGLCECFQVSPLVTTDLALASDENVELRLVIYA